MGLEGWGPTWGKDTPAVRAAWEMGPMEGPCRASEEASGEVASGVPGRHCQNSGKIRTHACRQAAGVSEGEGLCAGCLGAGRQAEQAEQTVGRALFVCVAQGSILPFTFKQCTRCPLMGCARVWKAGCPYEVVGGPTCWKPLAGGQQVPFHGPSMQAPSKKAGQ